MELNAYRHGPNEFCGVWSSHTPAGWRREWGSRIGIARKRRRRSTAGFTLIETVVATMVAGIVVPTLLAGIAYSFSSVRASREDLRATQVILQKMEAIRLSPYKMLKDPAAYPASVTEYYAPSSGTNAACGAAYKVTYNWAPAPTTLPPSYRSNMVMVTVSASWNSGKVQHNQSMQTFVARYGIQRYVSGN